MEFVYCNNEGLVNWGNLGSSIMTRINDVWRLDEPFVQARPDLFSATPLIVHSTEGREQLPATPVEVTTKRRPGRPARV